jgi:hypothetical protein
MKTRYLLLTLVMILAALPTLFGKKVEKEQARLVATNFLNERIANHQVDWPANTINLIDVTTRVSNGQAAYYVFSNNGSGYIIISAEDGLNPVLGYSYKGNFPSSGMSTNLDYYLMTFVDQVEYVRNQPSYSDQEAQNQWNYYIAGNNEYSAKATTDIEPLITSIWNQDTPYNQLCPPDASSADGHTLTGCVATAMSQIMYYYRYPVHGIGTHTYNAPGYGTQTVNYATTYYDWDGMLDDVSQSSGQSILSAAQLNYHAGVSVNMTYGVDASGAYSEDVPAALISHFGYASNTEYLLRTSYSATNWESIVVQQLDALKPVYYSGVDPTPVTGGGHAWICDGYQVTTSGKMFHFNFGWGGYDNGYFTLANPNGFTSQQKLIRNIVPATNYPYGCSSKVISDANGTFEDGSSPRLNYDPNSDCTWLIAPADSVNSINLSFIEFDVDPTDSLTVYDGANANAPVLGTFTGNSLPTAVNSTGGKLFLKFTTDGSAESKGWLVHYRSSFPSYCGTTTTLTAGYGDFADGSGDNNYNNNVTCKWKIQPLYATGLTINFNHFDLEENDQLTVYSIGTSSTLLATLTGNQIPDPIVSPTSGLLLMFKTNGYNTATGFDGYYTTSNVGTDKLTGISGLSVSPNPAKNYTVVRMLNGESMNMNLTINDMAGKQVFADHFAATKGSIEKTINLSDLKPGMYFLTLNNDKGKICRKLVVE